MNRFIAALATIILTGCASIDHTTRAVQATGVAKLAGPGDLVLRIERERNLENALGGADIFGRKTKEGFTELHFAGVEPGGEVVFYRKDVQILTNETTMSRTPFATTTGSATTNLSGTANSYGNTTQLNGTASTSYSSTTILPQSDYHVVVPSDTVAIRLAKDERRLVVSGYVVEVISVSSNALEYRVTSTE
jgi:hypothetical protein